MTADRIVARFTRLPCRTVGFAVAVLTFVWALVLDFGDFLFGRVFYSPTHRLSKGDNPRWKRGRD